MGRIWNSLRHKKKECFAFVLWLFLTISLLDPYYHWSVGPRIVHMLSKFKSPLEIFWFENWFLMYGIHVFVILCLLAYLLSKLKLRRLFYKNTVIGIVGAVFGIYGTIMTLLMMETLDIMRYVCPLLLSFFIPIGVAPLVMLIQWLIARYPRRNLC